MDNICFCSFREMIDCTLDILYNKEPELFNIDSSDEIEAHVGERAIVFRFGLYFQRALDECGLFYDYKLDCEYNRNGVVPKRLPPEGKLRNPDLILHQRGNNNHNLLVIDFKGWWNDKQEDDERKIKKMISKEGQYQFREGYTVLFGKNSAEVTSIVSE